MLALKRNSSAQREDWVIERANEKKILKLRLRGKNIAYIALNSVNQKKIIDDFEKILPQLYKCKGIILDLRKN